MRMVEMKQKRIVTSILCFFLLITTLCGCYNYKDINKVIFTTTTIFDEDELGNVLVYLDCVKPYRSASDSSDKGKRIIFKGKGKTVLEAIRDVGLASSYKVNFTQCRAYIFSEKVAKKGVKKYIDILNRDQEFIIRPYLFVLTGEVESLLKNVKGDEEYLGLYINDLVVKMKTSPRAIATNVNDYLNNRVINGNVSVLGTLGVKKDVAENRVELKGGAIFKNDKMVDLINVGEGMSYNFLNDNVKSGTLEIANPQDERNFLTLEILNSKTNTKIDYDGSRVKLYKDIDVKCSIAEVQGRIIVDEELLNYIKITEAENIKRYITLVFDTYKSKDLDVFKIQRLFDIKYPNEVVNKDVFSITDLVLSVNVNIEGGSNKRNSF